MSRHLSAAQLRGLRKAGEVIIPGDSDMPSFSRSGVIAHVDRMLDYANPSDLAGIKILLSLFGFLPRLGIRAILALSERDKGLPGPLGAACRMINIGMKGIVMTLYYSDFGDFSPSVLQLIHWDAQIKEIDE